MSSKHYEDALHKAKQPLSKLIMAVSVWRKSVFSKLNLTPSGREFYARGHPDGAPSPLPLLP